MQDNQDFEELKGIRRWWAEVRNGWQEQLQTNGFLRHLVHEPAFMVAIAALGVCGIGVAVMVPKVWNPAPPHFSRVIRVSLLDRVQAWNLRRTAANEVAAGRWEEALVAWRSAIANNLADASSHRGALEMLRDAPWVHSANLNHALFSSEYLLELTETNRLDATLVANVLIRHRLPEVALDLLRRWEKEFTEDEESAWLRALFAAGQFAAFEARWKGSAARLERDPEIALVRAALDASGPPSVAVDALGKLRSALADPARRLEAARLLCSAAARRDDPAEYERGLAVLRELESTMVVDEAVLWGLMARHDRIEEARKAAREFRPVPPPTAMEAVQLARAWSDLGLGDLAVEMFRENSQRYGMAYEVLAVYFDLLMERRLWDDVRRLAVSLRGNASGRDDVYAMTWFADAVADLSENRNTSARTYLKRLEEARIANPYVALRLASGLIRVGEFETSATLLNRIEPLLEKQPDFWMQVLIAAQGRRDVATLERGTAALLKLQPESVVALNMKLGLMLLKRESPAEALTLSMRLHGARVSSKSSSAGAVINHAAALLQNSRTAEASVILAQLDPARLGPQERAAWELARVEFLGQSGRFDEAIALGAKIDGRLLMPPDEAWLEKFLVENRKRSSGGQP
ncbi:MAG: hypothetical protein AB7O66_03330 [Limisphaerales bacterium]